MKDSADEIQHMNFIFLNFMFDKVKDTRTPARFQEVAMHGSEIDPGSPQVQAFIRLLQDRKTVLDPTINIFEGMFTDCPGTMSASYAAVGNRLPAQTAVNSCMAVCSRQQAWTRSTTIPSSRCLR